MTKPAALAPRWKSLKTLVFAAPLVAPALTFAEPPPSGSPTALLMKECGAVLVANVVDSTMLDNEFLDILNVVDETNYSKVKHEVNTSGRYGIISGSGDYADFEARRTALFQLNHFTRSRQDSLDYLSVHVPESARVLWLECIQRVLASPSDSEPFYLVAKEVTSVPYRIMLGYRGLAGTRVSLKSAWIENGLTLDGANGKSTRTLFSSELTLEPNNSRDYDITPTDANKAVSITVELANSDRRALTIAPPLPRLPFRLDDRTFALSASQVSQTTSTGVGNLNLTEDCSKNDGRVGFVCSADPAQPTRTVYDLTSVLTGPPGSYKLEIEYASTVDIPGVALHLSGQPNLQLDFPATGGPGMASRKVVSRTVLLPNGPRDLILDRGGRFPHLRGFIFTKM